MFLGTSAVQKMGDVELPECLSGDDSVSSDLPWKLALVVITVYWIKLVVSQIYSFCQTWFEEYITKSNLKYDPLIVQLENLHSKIDTLQKTSEGQSEVLEELKRGSDDLRSVLDMLRAQVETLQVPIISAAGTNSVAMPGPGAGGPPPPPPPPPPFSLVTPVVKIAPLSSAKTDLPKKKPTGPPQFSISQADITKMLQRLKKTSSTARLLGSGSNQPRKTPPRRKLFGRTPGHSRRRSITALSPGGDLTRHKTPLTSISPSAHDDADVNGNGCDFRK